ncbi:MAG: hypothetical protein ACRELB_19100 [Polyangiaceae bacterium]
MRDGRAGLLLLLLVGLASLAGLAGCAYDWTAGKAGGAADASTDGAHDGAGPAEGSTGSDASGTDAAGVDAPADVTGEPPSCADLEAQVAQALATALACNPTAQPCTTQESDACGCPVVLGAPGSATASYQSAVEALTGSSCPLGCGTCGPAPQQGLCIVSDASAAAYACAQY